MEEYLIVDGYNIIGAWPILIALRNDNLEDARDKLIELLVEYQAYSGRKVYVIFDAYKVPGLGRKYEKSALKIFYTKEKETADEWIERLVSELVSRRNRVYVATSDSVEQHVVFGKGALRMPARELLYQIEKNYNDIRNSIVEHPASSPNTIDSKLSGELRTLFEQWRRGKHTDD